MKFKESLEEKKTTVRAGTYRSFQVAINIFKNG